jgi:hypothetical protein
MPELTKTSVTPEEETNSEEVTEEAPYGYKADGTPRKRPGRKPGSSGVYSGGGRKKNFDSLKEPLADRLVEYLGPPIGIVSPLSLAVFEDRADKTAAALCQLAVTRPRIAKMINGMIAGSASVDLVLTGVAMIAALGIEFNRIEPSSMVAHYFGIDRMHFEMYPDLYANGNGHVPPNAARRSTIEGM